MTTPDQDTARWRRARVEALRLVATRLDGWPGMVALDDPDAVLSALSELAGMSLVRRFEAEGNTAAAARAWVAFAINQELANLAEVAGEQHP